MGIKSIFAKIFGAAEEAEEFVERSVAHIVAPLGNIIEELKEHAEDKLSLADFHQERSVAHKVAAREATTEAAQAQAAAQNIQKLIAVPVETPAADNDSAPATASSAA
ncbi:hypothetical protein SAMN05216548_114108 [Faunimonas pinastri]|uniref:Uncharacterized protein n=1 Tax=Faunimonas pinastri TaxID=1855383 RepID=A0A1H9MZ36_9HYPH|nr:hypothetical protein [Faunimonas pinastri]SER28729.1 hypothetical protein SAMN05216548_114108 [Faunimonas pinastri]